MLKKILNFLKSNKKNKRKKVFLGEKFKKSMFMGSFSGKRKIDKRNKYQLKLDFKNTKKYILIFFSMFLLIFIGGIIFLFYSSYFKVKYIEINDSENISSLDLLYNSVSEIRGKNILKLNKLVIKKNIIFFQENVRDVIIKKILPNKISIAILSYPISLKTKFDNNIYYITENGVLVPDSSRIILKKEIREINIIDDMKTNLGGLVIFDYQKKIKSKNIYKIVKLIDLFKVNLGNLNIDKIDYYLKEREILITIKNKTTLIFDLDKDILSQIKKLIIYNENNHNFKKIYVDLRVNSKIFSCNYSNEYQCRLYMRQIYKKR